MGRINKVLKIEKLDFAGQESQIGHISHPNSLENFI